jgi:hypothetical protein
MPAIARPAQLESAFGQLEQPYVDKCQVAGNGVADTAQSLRVAWFLIRRGLAGRLMNRTPAENPRDRLVFATANMSYMLISFVIAGFLVGLLLVVDAIVRVLRS